MGAIAIRTWAEERHARFAMKRWMLDFDEPATEREFRAYDDQQGLRTVRFAQVVGVLFTAAYAGVDLLVLPSVPLGVLLIRAGVIGYFLFGIVAVDRLPMVRRNVQVGSFALLTIVQVALGPVLGRVADFPTEYLRTSATVTFLGAIGLLRLRMHVATADAVVYIAVCLALPGVLGELGSTDAIGGVVAPTAGLTAIGLLVAYALERLRRTDFLRQRETEMERARSEEILHNVLPASIAQRLRSEEGAIADSASCVVMGRTLPYRDLGPAALPHRFRR